MNYENIQCYTIFMQTKFYSHLVKISSDRIRKQSKFPSLTTHQQKKDYIKQVEK
jgi:hypothetical protein